MPLHQQSSAADQPRVGGKLQAQNERKAGERTQLCTWWPLVPEPHTRAHGVTHQLPDASDPNTRTHGCTSVRLSH